MHRITESIDLKLPAEDVFAFLKDIESRLRLNPFYRVLSFEKLTEGDVGVGTRFRIVLMSGERRSEYISEVVEFVENKKIVTRDAKGRLRLALTLDQIPDGTRLTHDEEFVIPAELLYPEEKEQPDSPLWLKVIRGIIAIERVRFTDTERDRKVEEIKNILNSNLRMWLSKIKGRLEGGQSN